MKISANKSRIPILAIFGLLFSILLLLAITNIKDNTDINSRYRYFIYICLFLSVLYYTIIYFIDYLRVIFNPDAALLITDKGIVDNLGVFSCGNINWNEITNIQIKKVWGIKLLVINVNQPELLINQQSKWKQRTLRKALKRFGSPIVISQKRIKYNLDDLKGIMFSHRAQ